MKKWFGLFCVVTILINFLFMTGCSTTSGNIGHSIRTDVQLSQANYTVLKTVSGSAEADYFFNMGPNKQDLYAQAKRDMISQADLIGGSRAIITVPPDTQETFFGFIWTQKKVYVSGEVIEFK